MSKDEEDTSHTPRPRRASFAELFASRPNLDLPSAQQGTAARASSMAAAVTHQVQQQNHSRRLSITTLGLSAGSPPQPPTSFGSLKRGSIAGMARRSSMDESAVEDEEGGVRASVGSDAGGSNGAPPAGRRMSFGAKTAYKEMKATGAGESAITSTPAIAKSPSPAAAKGKEGFNWSENLRSRAERTSMSTAANPSTVPLSPAHNRVRSTSTAQIATPPQPPKQPIQSTPDAFQERILKGDFYMD